MTGNSQNSTSDQDLTAFFKGCEKNFRFLEQDHGFTYLSGLARYHKGRLVFSPYQPGDEISSTPQAVTLYERENSAIEISYDTSQPVFAVYVCFDRIHRFELQELLKAGRKSILPKWDITPAPQSLEARLKAAADDTRKSIALFKIPNPKLIERALTIREKLLEEKVRAKYKRELEDAAREAARAFAGKDYRRVIELYTPYIHHLSFAELKKLEIARNNLLGV